MDRSQLIRLTLAAVSFLSPISATTLAAGGSTLAEASQKALQQSLLTSPGNPPFHLKVSISEKSDPDSDDYKATIEELWLSPSKWRRIVSTKDFSQILVTNGDAVSESDTGDYYPHWFSNFVTSILEIMPEPMFNTIKQSSAVLPAQGGGPLSSNCVYLPARVDRWGICFEDKGLFQSIFTKGSGAEYKDYQKFGNKWVARSVLDYPQPGTTVEARIIELTPITNPDEQMFQVSQPTPPDQRVRSVQIDQDTFMKLVLGSSEIQWPSVGGGSLKGGCGVYVSADRSGNVREAIPEGCDNAGLEEPMHDAVMKWRLKPAAVGGVRVQVESLLGIPFETTLDSAKALPNLSDSEARKLAMDAKDPVFPPGAAPRGAEFTVKISVDETGKVTGLQNTQNLSTAVFAAIYSSIVQWHFSPYVKNGKPQYFHADLTFRVP
jgi:hypothetical protein